MENDPGGYRSQLLVVIGDSEAEILAYLSALNSIIAAEHPRQFWQRTLRMLLHVRLFQADKGPSSDIGEVSFCETC